MKLLNTLLITLIIVLSGYVYSYRINTKNILSSSIGAKPKFTAQHIVSDPKKVIEKQDTTSISSRDTDTILTTQPVTTIVPTKQMVYISHFGETFNCFNEYIDVINTLSTDIRSQQDSIELCNKDKYDRAKRCVDICISKKTNDINKCSTSTMLATGCISLALSNATSCLDGCKDNYSCSTVSPVLITKLTELTDLYCD